MCQCKSIHTIGHSLQRVSRLTESGTGRPQASVRKLVLLSKTASQPQPDKTSIESFVQPPRIKFNFCTQRVKQRTDWSNSCIMNNRRPTRLLL